MRSTRAKIAIWLTLLMANLAHTGASSPEAPSKRGDELLLIVGAAGESAYAEGFAEAADSWERLADEASVSTERVDTKGSEADAKDRIHKWISNLEPTSPHTAWIVYLGHGTHGGSGTKLNLRGPDLSLDELQSWLAPIERPLVFIHGGSASGPFIPALSQPGRIIITATKSAEEQNYARFGEVFVDALQTPRSDLDLDGQVSLLEAFISASNTVETSYAEAGRLATEHALFDDNGDGKGTPATWFRGLRPIEARIEAQNSDGSQAKRLAFLPAEGGPSLSADQLRERKRLEKALEELKRQKHALDPDDYYGRIERLFLELAKVYLGDNKEDS